MISLGLSNIEIKRGYEVLPDNNVRFGVRVINDSDSAISDVEVILDYTESLFEIDGDKIQKLGTIPPTVPRTAKFILKPLGCIHKEEIGATVLYKDHQWKKHVEQMRPKEVHCVCPFLKGKKMPRAEFLELSGAGHSAETGLNFMGVTVDRLTSFLVQTCKSRHYKVDDFSIDGGRMLYLASESIGEKAYYLLTALIKEEDDLTQVMLRAVSDKPHGLNGFLNETVADLRHVVETVQSAREIGIIKKEQVINIIDSVVQRSTISMEEGAPSVKIKDSMVQRVEIKGDEERKRREEERKARQIAEIKEKERQNAVAGEHLKKQKEPLMPKIEPSAQVKNKGGGIKTALTVVGFVVMTVMLAAVIAAFVFGLGGTKVESPMLNIIASNDPETAIADMMIQHRGGDPLMGGEWKLSIVQAGNPPNYVIPPAGIEFTVADKIIAAATTEGGAYITTGEGAYTTDSVVNGNVKLLSGKKYDVKLVHIPSNAMLFDQVVEIR